MCSDRVISETPQARHLYEKKMHEAPRDDVSLNFGLISRAAGGAVIMFYRFRFGFKPHGSYAPSHAEAIYVIAGYSTDGVDEGTFWPAEGAQNILYAVQGQSLLRTCSVFLKYF